MKQLYVCFLVWTKAMTQLHMKCIDINIYTQSYVLRNEISILNAVDTSLLRNIDFKSCKSSWFAALFSYCQKMS